MIPLAAAAGVTARRRAAAALTTIDEIRIESMRANDDPIGRPLPLAAVFETSGNTAGTHTRPAEQVALIEAGRRLLPSFWWFHADIAGGYPGTMSSSYGDPLNQVKAWGLPVTFVASQWERLFYNLSRYSGRPFATNPLVFGTNEQILDFSVDPIGPSGAWDDLADDWLDNGNVGTWDLETVYPDPPFVLLFSNNEGFKHLWTAANTSKRFVDAHGTGTSSDQKRLVYGDGWVNGFGTLFQGFRDWFTAPAWKNGVRTIGYNVSRVGFMGRFNGWRNSCLTVNSPLRLDPNYAMWDGTCYDCYIYASTAITDFNVWSAQIEAMNNIPSVNEAFANNPDYWHEVIFWDGFTDSTSTSANKRAWYASVGQTYTPARYEGLVQFQMWLAVPRVVREFRRTSESRETIGFGYFDAILDSVDRVYDDADLRRFWRNSDLVENTAETHPYQLDLTSEIQALPRWWLLTADVNPARPWTLSTELLVYAIARVRGESPNREWLVYAHSPRQDRTGVTLTVPGFGNAVMDVTQAGSFYLVDEAAGTVTPVEV